MNNFTVDILTPNKVVAKDIPAENVFIPTLKGQIEVMKDHTHIVEKLDTGLITVIGSGDEANRYFTVTTGICKVLAGKVQILSNTSEESFELDLERAEHALKDAQGKLANTTLSDEEIVKYQRKVERAKLRIHCAKLNAARK
ncbi:ATP synthase F1, epsilon subunit [Bacteriovorax sp. BSW11_IV]|uniref:ATP synthase F1 subunit epsilon n=1 Tax=Bacteriovorax sp. BSW11_IV TaxID=1353529 RepID=UPI00038A39EF|nr:ATP synthase F1 subunit epsilon [Bacteriovorax sp. BSW11_IV]EQC50002.1 ATP synthase F1, epsilon subunit [Bacteriovorax sp. BSW11_IV]